MIVYLIDADGYFLESQNLDDPHASLPPCVMTPPPGTTGTQVAQWTGSAWTVLAQKSGPVPPEPLEPPEPPNPMLIGVPYNGVMCSATSADAAGLLQVQAGIALMGSEFKTPFLFANGTVLELSGDNFLDFMKDHWVPFRQGFFQPPKG